MKLKSKKGITLIALVVTIIILLILAGITIATLTGDNGVVKNATEAQIKSELSNVKEGLETYKVKKEMINTYQATEITDEQLVGDIYHSIFVNDTFRQIGVIGDLTKINVKSKLGKQGGKIEFEEIETLFNLKDVFVVDFANGTLYYIGDNQIWSIEGIKKEYEIGKGDQYEIESTNKEYIEKRKFITEWKVAKGEQVVLPISKHSNMVYNYVIEWGDGQESKVQHKVTVNGQTKTMTEEEMIAAVTHTYETEATDNTREIKIVGLNPSFRMSPDGSAYEATTPSRDKLVKIKQWGNIQVGAINFIGCTNLSGEIPSPEGQNTFGTVGTLNRLFSGCSKITGNIPKDLFWSGTNVTSFTGTFEQCKGLTGSIPKEIFLQNTQVRTFDNTFFACEGLTGSIPKDLFQPSAGNITSLGSIFAGCKGLTGEIPEGLLKGCTNLTVIGRIFRDCVGLTKIPENLFYDCPNNISFGGAWMGTFDGCTGITEIPEGLFDQQTETTKIEWVFRGCSGITKIPENLFAKNTKVQSFASVFQSCSSLKEVPANLFQNNSHVTNIAAMFRSCTSLTTIQNGFTIPQSVNTMQELFYDCSKLNSISNSLVIPNGVTDLTGLFYACKSITGLPNTFRIPEGITNISNMFAGMASMTSLPDGFVIPESVTSMKSTFDGCNKLTVKENFVIPSNVTDISRCFYSNWALNGSIVIKATPTSFSQWFGNPVNSNKITLNYSSTCTNIDDIMAGAGNANVMKGQLIG